MPDFGKGDILDQTPSTQEIEAGRLQSQGQPDLHGQTLYKNQKRRGRKRVRGRGRREDQEMKEEGETEEEVGALLLCESVKAQVHTASRYFREGFEVENSAPLLLCPALRERREGQVWRGRALCHYLRWPQGPLSHPLLPFSILFLHPGSWPMKTRRGCWWSSASGGTHADREGRIRTKKTEESGAAIYPTAFFLWGHVRLSVF